VLLVWFRFFYQFLPALDGLRACARGRSAETDKQTLCETSRVAPASPVLLVWFRFFYQFLPALDGLRACARGRSAETNRQTTPLTCTLRPTV
jgi:hypothetical protein